MKSVVGKTTIGRPISALVGYMVIEERVAAQEATVGIGC